MEAAETQGKPGTGMVVDRMKKERPSDEVPSPRGVLDNSVSGSESDQSSTSSSSNSGSSVPPEKTASGNWPLFGENPGSQWKSLIDNIKRRSARRFSMVPLLSGYDRSIKHIKRYAGRNRSADDAISCSGFLGRKPSWKLFTYEELAAATDNFSSEKLIGKGGHADVYRGRLSNGQAVAVKRTTCEEKKDEDRVSDFLTELGIIAHINHPNATRLLGYSVDGGLHLVFEFLTNGSLASVLFDSSEAPEWKIRFKVILGVAEGLNYLHSECQRRIIHRDITAANILLTEDYEPQISDFGLAKWLPEKWINHVVSPIEGTFGYMAPEYFMHGIVDEKTDVFAFGVLLLELITGQRAVGSSQQSLVTWAKPLLEKVNMKAIADPRLGDAYDVGEMKRTMLTASSCLHHLPSLRPSMSRVVQLLRGEHGAVETKASFGGSAVLLEACDLEGYTRKTYLKDLHRHMQLVME